MATECTWRGETQIFYDGATHERIMPMAPLLFYEDFIGADTAFLAMGAAAERTKWTTKIVGSATVAVAADGANGLLQCAMDATDEAQSADLNMDDNRQFSVEQNLCIEMRARLSVLPTSNSELHFGLIGDYNAVPDTVTYSAFFTADGSGEIFCEVDDNATNSSATSGVTATAAQTKIFRIEFLDVTDVRFYIDGAHVATGTTFPYAATGANAVLQPSMGGYKASGTGVGTLLVDYVKIWGDRS